MGKWSVWIVLKTIPGAGKEEVCETDKSISIVVIHDLNLAMRFSDKFLLLKENTIFAYGDMEVMTPENISSVYGVKVTVEKINGIPVVIPLEDVLL